MFSSELEMGAGFRLHQLRLCRCQKDTTYYRSAFSLSLTVGKWSQRPNLSHSDFFLVTWGDLHGRHPWFSQLVSDDGSLRMRVEKQRRGEIFVVLGQFLLW